MDPEELKRRIEFTQSYRDLMDASERLNRDIIAIIQTDAKGVQAARIRAKDFLGERFGAEKAITIQEFIKRIDRLNRMDILAYQLNTCPLCLGELKGETLSVGKRIRKCGNCSFVLTVSYRGC